MSIDQYEQDETHAPPAKQARPLRAARRPYQPECRVVAITGAHGFVGAEIIRRLERDRRFYKVLAIDIRKPAFPPGKTQFHRVDLTMPAADGQLVDLLRREGVDTLVHAAFLSSPTHNTTWAHELESLGTMHVLNACGEAPVHKLLMWSQTAVYGPGPQNPNYLTEEYELRTSSRSRFVKDKVEAERQLRYFARENPDIAVTALRTAPMLGPTVRNFTTRFFSRPVCPVLMGFDPLLQFVHEQDAIDAFLLALLHDRHGAFNVVGDGVLPYSTVRAMMGRLPLPMPHFVAYPLSQALWATQIFDAPPDFLDFLRYLCVADGEKARRELGFRPRYNIKETIEDFLGIAGDGPAVREMAS